MSRYDKYSENALKILLRVQDIAMRTNKEESGTSDLAEALLVSAVPDIVAIARTNNSSIDDLRLKALNERLEGLPPAHPASSVKISGEFRGILDEAEKLAGDTPVEPEHLIRAAWPLIKSEIAPYLTPESAPALAMPPDDIDLPAPRNRADDGFDAYGVIARFGRELTAPGEAFPVYGREREIDGLVSSLLKFYKPNPLVIGESGVGKTALVHGLANRIRSGKVPPALRDARLFEVRASDLLAGTNVHGALEENVMALVDAVESSPDVILFMDEIHQVVPAFANNPISEIMKPALSRGKFRCIGATTSSDYHRYLEKDEAFARRFQTMLVKEPSRTVVMEILEGVRPRLEKHFGLSIDAEALKGSLELSERFLPSRHFPDKALDVLDRACSKASFDGDSNVALRHLRAAVTDIANIKFEGDEKDLTGLVNIESAVRADILGQDVAIKAVCDIVRVNKKRLDLDDARPDGAFLFTGPTGVGKTAFAESLSRAVSGRDDALFRIDMSEFTDAHTASRLIGAPPGYIGYDDVPLLTKASERYSGGVLLLDEFEKAHPQVHRLFLQLLDSGRITDNSGKTLSFANITVIATCNVGAEGVPVRGFAGDGNGDAAVPLARLKQVFPAELLNRFDAIVPFASLSSECCARILEELVIGRTNERLASDYGFTLAFDADAEALVSERGFSRDFGARNLKRAFRELVTAPLAPVVDSFAGAGTVRVRKEGDHLVFTPA